MNVALPHERIEQAYQDAKDALLDARAEGCHWTGELSTSPLSTATALVALEMVRRAGQHSSLEPLIAGGLCYLAESQNSDGGWGDTTKSLSNISTTMLANAAFHATGKVDRYQRTVDRSQAHIDMVGGIEAVALRYGKDRTFSAPILTHCALAGVVDWSKVPALPFELACVPASFYKWLRLPVVSYALPALIAIGQVRYQHGRPWNPLTRLARHLARERSLAVLRRIQPAGGGYLEATPLTAFVTMSLADLGLADHPVAREAVSFLKRSVRPDGSWPIDTNLATWVTTLSVNALGDDLPAGERTSIRDWLLGQQLHRPHPFTGASAGGWAWTDLPGGVPDADDTPGALLALRQLDPRPTPASSVLESACLAIGWLLGLQNRDGGWPTFCRGWGWLPFDRSAPDLTAHVLRALEAWREPLADRRRLARRMAKAVQRGRDYLARQQRPDGSWLPLWFGNEHCPDEQNPTYGTARVRLAYRALGWQGTPEARRAADWLLENQNSDGGWGGGGDTASSVEETALATEALLDVVRARRQVLDGLRWLVERVEEGTFTEPAPIGVYFAKLWYYEMLYPVIFTVSALGRARRAQALFAPRAAELRPTG